MYISDKISDNSVNKRCSNFELLRIFAMLLIVLSHLSGHGIRSSVTLLNDTFFHQINNTLLFMFGFSGKIGVNIFLLISGYFLVNKMFTPQNFLKIYVMTIFYSLMFLCLSFVIGCHSVKTISIIQSIFPIGGNAYWFITNYLVLFIFLDYINCFLKQLSKNDYQKLLLICFVLWSIIPTITIKANYGFSLLNWFLFVYSIGAYLKIYNIRIKLSYCIYMIFILVFIQSVIIYIILQANSCNILSTFFNINNLYQFLMAFLIFNIFSDIKLKQNLIINNISSSVFAVYLIHDNIFVRPYLWHNILHIDHIFYLKSYVFSTILIVISIFCFCVLADKIFCKIYKPITIFIINLLDKYYKK